jgi:AsmA protein
MRRNAVPHVVRKLALAITACVAFAVVAPMLFTERRLDETFAIATVSAAPRDLHVLTVPVRLSAAPDLTLERAVIYDFGPGTAAATASGGPEATRSQVLLDGPVLTLDTAGGRAVGAGDSASAAPSQEAISPLLQQIAGLAFDLIAIRRGTLHIAMADGSIETLTDIQAEVKKGRKSHAILGSFTVRGQRLAFDATFSQPPDKKAPTRWPLQVTFKAGLLQGSFDGQADLGEEMQLSGDTELSTASLRAVGRWFGLPLYLTDGFNATTVKGELTWARRSLAFDKARITVDGNEGNGRLSVSLGAERPLIEATLDFAALNLTPYVEATRTQLFGFGLPGAWGSSFDVSLPMIRSLDADLRISARRVSLKDYALGQGGATITAQSGKLHADITELELPWGTLSAQVTAIMSEASPRYALRAKIEGMDTGPASALVLGAPALTGRASLALDLTSTGYLLAEVAKRLSGKAVLAMPEGGRLGLDLRALRTAAKTEGRGWSQLGRAHTGIDQLEARALVIDGVAFADQMQARSGDVALALVGRLGLVDGNLDARLLWKPGVPSDQPLKLTDAAVEAVTLRGPWRKPDIHGEDAEVGAPKVP